MDESDLARFFERTRKQSQRERWTLTEPAAKDPRRRLARLAETQARERIEAMGLRAVKQAHSARFDLMVEGLRVEVKASRWDGKRYEANLRGNQADVLLFGCLDGKWSWFVIPFEVVDGLTVIKVTTHDPADYMGRYTPFYEAWDLVRERAAMVRSPYQLDFGM